MKRTYLIEVTVELTTGTSQVRRFFSRQHKQISFLKLQNPTCNYKLFEIRELFKKPLVSYEVGSRIASKPYTSQRRNPFLLCSDGGYDMHE